MERAPAAGGRFWAKLVRIYAGVSGLGTSLAPADHPEYDRWLANVCAELGEGAFAVAWADGRAMPLEQAVAKALAVEEPPDQRAA